jgi:hypothetical protein
MPHYNFRGDRIEFEENSALNACALLAGYISGKDNDWQERQAPALMQAYRAACIALYNASIDAQARPVV